MSKFELRCIAFLFIVPGIILCFCSMILWPYREDCYVANCQDSVLTVGFNVTAGSGDGSGVYYYGLSYSSSGSNDDDDDNDSDDTNTDDDDGDGGDDSEDDDDSERKRITRKLFSSDDSVYTITETVNDYNCSTVYIGETLKCYVVDNKSIFLSRPTPWRFALMLSIGVTLCCASIISFCISFRTNLK